LTSTDRRATTAVVSDSLGRWTEQWNALVAAAPLPTPFLRSWWLTTVTSSPTFVLVCDGDTLIGGLALQQRFRLLGVPVYQFAGSGVLCPDHLDAVAAPRREADVARELHAWLTRPGSRVLDLDGVVADSLLATAFPDMRVETVDVAPWDLLPATVEEYLATRSAQQRKALRQVQRRLAVAGVSYRQVQPVDAQEVLDAFAWLQRVQGGRERLLAELPRLAPAVIAGMHSGEARIDVMEGPDGIIAVWIYFVFAGAIRAYQSARSMAREASSVESVLLLNALGQACAEGCREFDMLRGAEPYKFRFVTRTRSIQRLRVANGVRGNAVLSGLAVATRARRRAGALRRWWAARRSDGTAPSGN
jgi:CelD/BcsL family acetyltransferase involved in cellulose biosynthesis